MMSKPIITESMVGEESLFCNIGLIEEKNSKRFDDLKKKKKKIARIEDF